MLVFGALGACERHLGHEPVCGDGVVESPETCDGDCSETCDDGIACTADVMSGSPGTCDVMCAHDPIVTCQSGDGCCPGSCNTLEDDDCTSVCGNGLVEPPETCDGDCPGNCDDQNACTVDERSGDSETCDVLCSHEPIVVCTSGDGCCPGGGQGECHALNDGDCAPLCGNGVIEPPEECDDGSTVGGDGCGATCLFEVCGNGYQDVDEACDDGNTADGDGCSAGCLSDESCGNGVLDLVTGEECDDGSTLGGDGCSAGCLFEVCGNGILDVGEACDDSNTTDGDGCSEDCLSDETCGNGVTDAVTGEECDDGNGVDWDGCTGCAITEFQVNTCTAGSQGDPVVAMAPDGRFVVVWESRHGQDGHWTGVFGQRYDSNGGPAGGEFQVNTFWQNDQDHPVVAMAPEGRFVVVWMSSLQDGSSAGVFAQRYDSSGNPAGSEFQVNTYTQDHQTVPSVGMALDGRFTVVWASYATAPQNSQDGSDGGVFGQRFDSSGNPAGGEFQVNTHTDGGQGAPEIRMTADGSTLVVWSSSNTDASHIGSFGQRYDSSGSPLGGEFQIVFNDYPEIPLVMKMAMAADGGFVVARDGLEIMAQLFSNTGAPASSYFQVNTYPSNGTVYWPEVAMAEDGRFVVVWNSYGQDGDDDGVFAQRFDTSGNMVGGEFQVHVYTQGAQIQPSVAMAPDGSFVVAWTSGQDIDGGVFAQRYDPQGNPLGRGP